MPDRYYGPARCTPTTGPPTTGPPAAAPCTRHNFTLLKYAGNGMWSYEEDVYNPARFGEMVKNCLRQKKTLAAEAEIR